jgi:hypothetical protein
VQLLTYVLASRLDDSGHVLFCVPESSTLQPHVHTVLSTAPGGHGWKGPSLGMHRMIWPGFHSCLVISKGGQGDGQG